MTGDDGNVTTGWRANASFSDGGQNFNMDYNSSWSGDLDDVKEALGEFVEYMYEDDSWEDDYETMAMGRDVLIEETIETDGDDTFKKLHQHFTLYKDSQGRLVFDTVTKVWLTSSNVEGLYGYQGLQYEEYGTGAAWRGISCDHFAGGEY